MTQPPTPIDISTFPQLEALCRQITATFPRGIFHLHGDLGSGKTTFVQTLLRQLGYTGIVNSPTYALVQEYELGPRHIIHSDLYRLQEPEELLYLDVRDWPSRADYIFIEWPERGGDLLPPATARLPFQLQGTQRFPRLER